MKEEINRSMKEIASRKPGNSKLVYDRQLRSIVLVDRSGNRTATSLSFEESNCI